MTTTSAPLALSFYRKPKPYKAVWVSVSVVAHAVLLGAVIYMVPAPLPVPSVSADRTIFVDIEPVTLPREIPARVIQPESRTYDSPPRAITGPDRPVPRIVQQRPDTAGSNAQASGPASETAADASDGRWTYTPESTASGVARSLRTSPIGCAYPERLSEGERALCNERSTDRAVRALEKVPRITGTGDARRDSRFEAQGRARENTYNYRRRPITNDETGNGRPTDTPGSNFGIGPSGRHLDPSTQPDAYGPIQTYRRDGRPEERNVTTPR